MDKFSGNFADRVDDETLYKTKEDREHAALVSIACSLEIIAEVLEAWSQPPLSVVVKTEEQPVWPSTPVVT